MTRRAAAPGEGMRWRVGFVAVALLSGLGAVGWRLTDLQLLQAARFKDLAEAQTLREVVVAPRRGPIVDRKGEALALSVDVQSVRADPSRIGDKAGAARRLAKALKVDEAALRGRLERGRYFAWVKRRVSPDEARAVEALKLEGIGFTRESRRFYPHRELASALLGFAGLDGVGLEGLERRYDSALKGSASSAMALRDARGNRLYEPDHLAPGAEAGGTVTLTLDRTIQWISEAALDEAMASSGAKAGTVVVLEPSTGEILAAASRPTYNPNEPQQSGRAHRRNRVVSDSYEPGSTFKVFTVAAALEAGLVQTHSKVDASGGRLKVAGHTINDARDYGAISPGDILRVSSNVGSANLALQLGREDFVAALRAFGFGERTGAGLMGEQAGILRPPRRLSELDLATMAFGQGVSATPLQMAAAGAVVANGGRLMRPFLVREVRDREGHLLEAGRPELVRTVLSPETARQVGLMMESVVAPGGTGTRAAVPGHRVAGKTGTSQKADPLTGGYSEEARVASFMGFVPAGAPRLMILVVLDEPQGVKYGGVVAAPVFAQIAERALRYLGVPATEPLPPPEAAPKIVARRPSREVDDPVELLVNLLPPPEGKTLVPDLVGMDLRAAAQLLGERHLLLRTEGAGEVLRQRPAAGVIAAPGDTVTLELGATAAEVSG